MIAKKYSKKKTFWQNKILYTLLILLNFSIIVFLFSSNVKLYSERQKVKAQSINLNKEINNLEQKKEELRNLFSADTDQEYTERILREKGLYQKPGEKVVVIKRENLPTNRATTTKWGTQPKTASLLDKIGIFLKNIFRH